MTLYNVYIKLNFKRTGRGGEGRMTDISIEDGREDDENEFEDEERDDRRDELQFKKIKYFFLI